MLGGNAECLPSVCYSACEHVFSTAKGEVCEEEAVTETALTALTDLMLFV